MKRKRGNKKGKAKRTPVVEVVNDTVQNVVSVNSEDDSGMDEGNDEIDSGMDVGTPSSAGTGNGLPENLGVVNSDRLIEKAKGNLVYGRVKVKIKNSKTLDSHHASSDAPTQSDTDKSSPQVDMEKHGVVSEKMEDSANSLLVYGNSSKKSGSIKIKSSRMLGSSGLNGCSTKAQQLLGDRTYQKDPEHPLQDAQHNRQELHASLEVIKKVMKMDAAEPFNAPVNPIDLGIPDYFQVIDTPMDFGTICSNLESGVKYKNSEDVFKDVRLVWENCYKYNNKGDYVVELMKRVKKNLMKYWTAAGLFTEQSQGTSGAESMQAQDTATPSNAKFIGKSGPLKFKNRKRHGVKKHKDDCLCAICVMMRRRQEREETTQESEDRMESNSSRQVKLEEPSGAESMYSGDTSSNMDNSEGHDAEAELEEKRELGKLAASEKQSPVQEKQEKEDQTRIELKDEIVEQSEPDERVTEEHERDYPLRMMQSGGNIQADGRKEETSLQQADETGAAEQNKLKELAEERQKYEMYENIRRLENPVLLELCGTLFPNNNHKSAWSGPHSLVSRQGPPRRSSIHEAIATFLK